MLPLRPLIIDFLIAGLHKAGSARVEQEVRRAVCDVQTTDEWRFALLPSDQSGRWNVGVRGPDRWSITTFEATLEDLPRRAAAAVLQLLQT
jgi:hypothetical protein